MIPVRQKQQIPTKSSARARERESEHCVLEVSECAFSSDCVLAKLFFLGVGGVEEKWPAKQKADSEEAQDTRMVLMREF